MHSQREDGDGIMAWYATFDFKVKKFYWHSVIFNIYYHFFFYPISIYEGGAPKSKLFKGRYTPNQLFQGQVHPNPKPKLRKTEHALCSISKSTPF